LIDARPKIHERDGYDARHNRRGGDVARSFGVAPIMRELLNMQSMLARQFRHGD
jgi:hypothetical protein